MSEKKGLSKGALIAALDIGSHKTTCFIAQIDENKDLKVIGVGYQASQGIKNGTIMDLSAVENTARKVVHAAENMAVDVTKGYPLRDVVVHVPSIQSVTQFVSVNIEISGQEVTDKDLKRAISKAQRQGVDETAELIHSIPVGYHLDGKSGITDPKGLHGNDLGVDITVVQTDPSSMKNITSVVERSHLDIKAMCVGAYASGLASMVEDEMNLGATVIDIGAGTTSIGVFHNGKLVYSGAIPVGGAHVTNDVARGLNTPINDAERIKTLYGSAISSSFDDNEILEVPQLGETDGVMNSVPRSMLNGIIRPRLEEIFEMVRAKLDESGLLEYLGRNVVLTGGAAQMPGMRELAQSYLDKQVRIGKPHALKGVPDMANGPAFSTATGLLLYMRDRYAIEHSVKLSGDSSNDMFGAVRQWFKENW